MSDNEGASGIPDLGQVLQTAQRMQQELQRVQSELADQIVEGSAGGGMVVARCNGRSQLVSITFEREVVDPDDTDMLQDLVVAAVNQALSKSSELAQQQMSKITGGLPIQLPEGLL